MAAFSPPTADFPAASAYNQPSAHSTRQGGNGRIGRLVMFKECLANHVVPFIITEEFKLFYYRGLSEWGHINGYLTDTCLTGQDQYKALLDYFKIKY